MVLTKREEYIAKANPSRFSKSISVEELEKSGYLNFKGLHLIAVERCKRHFNYDGSAYVYDYRCVNSNEITQHNYNSAEDRFVCTAKRCSERDFLHKLSFHDDLSFAYDFLVSGEEDDESIEATPTDVEEEQTKVTLPPSPTDDGNARVRDVEFELAPKPKPDFSLFPKILNFGETMPKEDKFLVYPYLPQNQLSLIFGYSGVMKSTFCRYVAAKFSVGGRLFDQKIDAGPILYLAAEGTERNIYDDIEEFGGNMKNINACDKPI